MQDWESFWGIKTFMEKLHQTATELYSLGSSNTQDWNTSTESTQRGNQHTRYGDRKNP